jgi:hypothetical protein
VDKLSRERAHCERFHDEAVQACKDAHAAEVRELQEDKARLQGKVAAAVQELQQAREDAATRVCLLLHVLPVLFCRCHSLYLLASCCARASIDCL